MSNVKLYTGKQLVEYGVTKSESGLPSKGLKEVIPTGTWLEQKKTQNALEERKLMLCERIEKWGNLSHAEWVPGKRLARYIERRGSYMQFFGFPDGEHYYLYPEEALHLMEVNCLLLRYNGVLVSLQQGYSLLLDKDMTLDEYRVYSCLCRKGYKLLRHGTDEKDTLTEYEKAINIQPLEKTRSFYKKMTSTTTNEDKGGSKSDSAVVEACNWHDMPVILVGEITESKTTERPEKRMKVTYRPDESIPVIAIAEDATSACNIISIDDNDYLDSNQDGHDSDDCIIVKSKDDLTQNGGDMDVDCVPVETESVVTMPNVYRREEIVIITPNKLLLPPNVQPTKSLYKIDIKELSRRHAVKRNYGYSNRNSQIIHQPFDRGGARQFANNLFGTFATYLFRQILQRQAFIANFWPPTYRHNCVPHPAFLRNSNSIYAPFMSNPHVSLYPQSAGTTNSFRLHLNNMMNSRNGEYVSGQPISIGNSPENNGRGLRNPRSNENRQLEQIKALISKFDLLKTLTGVTDSTLDNVKTAIDNLLIKFNESCGQNHTINSLRNSETPIQSQVFHLSSDSEDEVTENSSSIDNGRIYVRKRTRSANDNIGKHKSNVIAGIESTENSSRNSTEIRDDGSIDNIVTSTTSIGEGSSFPKNWSANSNCWGASKIISRNSRQMSFLYSEYLLSFMKKSKSMPFIRSWKSAKKGFEESLQNNTICINDDDDDQDDILPKQVLLSLKVDKIQPLIRPQDCESTSSILRRLSVVKKANISEKVKELQTEKQPTWFKINFDVYPPNAKRVKKENLAKPLFRVICRRVVDPLPNLLAVTKLLEQYDDAVPLKWAIVGFSTISFMQLGHIDLPTQCRSGQSVQ